LRICAEEAKDHLQYRIPEGATFEHSRQAVELRRGRFLAGAVNEVTNLGERKIAVPEIGARVVDRFKLKHQAERGGQGRLERGPVSGGRTELAGLWAIDRTRVRWAFKDIG